MNAVPRRLENENKPICLDDDSGSDDDAANQSAASSPGDIFGDYSPVSSKARSNKAVDKRNAKKAANNAVGARRAAKAKPAKPTGCRRAMPDLNEAVIHEAARQFRYAFENLCPNKLCIVYESKEAEETGN